ncbi:hypothetical protein [Anabaena sp. CCY 9910]|uniref:hypothetical protein n=1 Tax=Anabaena sp. CCY 9910 TaxID=3103870 RepID=UPI0039DF4C1E
MYQIYTVDTLKAKKLDDLKAIASQLGAVAEDKRSKQSWIDAIVVAQPQKTENQPVVCSPMPTKENPLTVEEAAQSGYKFSYAGAGNFLVIKGYNEKGMVVVNDGWDDLTFSVERIELMTYGLVVSDVTASQSGLIEAEVNIASAVKTCANCPHFNSHGDGTDKGWRCLFDRFAREQHATTQGCINSMEEVEQEQVDDYLFHDDPPKVGDTHLIGDFALVCKEVAGEYAAVWEVRQGKQVLGDIRMDWQCFWTHTMSLTTFSTPQEATVDLHESLQKYKQEQVSVTQIQEYVLTDGYQGYDLRLMSLSEVKSANTQEKDMTWIPYNSATMGRFLQPQS